MTNRPSALASLLASTGLRVEETTSTPPKAQKPLTATQSRCLDLIREPGGHALGEGTGIRAGTAKALAARGLVVVGRIEDLGLAYAISVEEVATPPSGFVAGRGRGRPARAESAASRRIEFRVSPREADRIERLLHERGGSLSDLVRELLEAEAGRLGVTS